MIIQEVVGRCLDFKISAFQHIVMKENTSAVSNHEARARTLTIEATS